MASHSHFSGSSASSVTKESGKQIAYSIKKEKRTHILCPQVALIVMVSLPLMHRRLHRCHDGVVALVAVALLPLPMSRRLAVVNDDGEGTTGDSIDDNCDSALNVNNDGDGRTDDNIDKNDCDGQRCRQQRWR